MQAQGTSRRRLLLWGGLGVVAAGTALAVPLALEHQEPEKPRRRTQQRLVLEENFEGTSLDSAVWSIRNDQAYQRDWGLVKASNVSVAHNVLSLQARRLEEPVERAGRLRRWSCAEVSTQGKCAVEYGKWQFQTRIPVAPERNAGFWTSVWLRPEDTSLGGEIDVVEGYGSKTPERRTSFNPDNRSQSTVHFDQSGTFHSAAWSPARYRLSQEWSTWTMERTPAGVRIHCGEDEVLFVPSDHEGYARAFPSGTKMHVRVSFQVGNPYWGLPDAQSQDGAAIHVRSLRIWEYPDGHAA